MEPIRPQLWKMKMSFSGGRNPEDGLRRLSGLLEGLGIFLDSVPGLGAEGRADLLLVCDEIGSNVVRHAARTGDVRLAVRADAEGYLVRLRIADDGGAFDPFSVSAPDLEVGLDEREIGGLGVFLVCQLFPLAEYRRVGMWNVVEVKYALGEDGGERMGRRSDTRDIVSHTRRFISATRRIFQRSK